MPSNICKGDVMIGLSVSLFIETACALVYFGAGFLELIVNQNGPGYFWRMIFFELGILL